MAEKKNPNYARLKKSLVRWLARELKSARAKGFVVGISGGVDSAVVTALCRLAAGEHVLGIILPCENSASDIEDAELVASHFGVRNHKADLGPTYKECLKVLPEGTRLARANLKPRLRMVALYYFANSLNYLVAGTGNKSELMMGYFTKHGDGGVDLLPLGNLLKRDVRNLARELGVPEPVLAKPPTAGLWPGQTDEGEMVLSYEELDRILSRTKNGIDRKKIGKVHRTIRATEHKRNLAKIFPWSVGRRQ